MPKKDRKKPSSFNIISIVQNGRLGFEAVALASSLRRASPDFAGRLIFAEPAPEEKWHGVDTEVPDQIRNALTEYGAEIIPFTAHHFGQEYPYGNKMEALSSMPENENFLFLDTDTLIIGDIARMPFDFSRPSASMRRSATWPEPPLYGPGYTEIWRSLYERFGLDFESSLDLTQFDEHWERYLYFNAGWFFGQDPKSFGERYLDWALQIRNEPGDALACQTLDVHLDQVALPLVIHSLGGGRPGPELSGMDGDVTCHYRYLGLLYARESDAAVEAADLLAQDKIARRILREWDPFKTLVLRNAGLRKARPMFDRSIPENEKRTRNVLKRAGYFTR